jgi:phospholipid/cholesterol/gamma-HCH transport system substrate-binding protein
MMGNLRWIAIKLTVFTLVTIAVTIWLAAIIGNLRLFSSPYVVTAEFTDASGLLQGDVVKAAGVTVGRVADIRISDGIALVDLSVDEGVDLPAGMGAEIRFRNLVGQRMVTLVGEGSATDTMVSGDVISLDKTRGAFDLTALFNGLRPLIRSTDPHDVNIVTREVVAALQGREEELEGFLGNVALVSDTLADKDAELTRLLDGFGAVAEDLAGRDRQLNTTLAAMADFVSDLAADRDALDQALITLSDAATRLRGVVDRNDVRIAAEVKDLEVLLDAIDDEKKNLRSAIRALPDFLVATERATTYGQWANIHLIHVCKDDFGTCGSRWAQ